MQADLALGLDIGGTSTRALVIDIGGDRLGSGKASGANITSHSPDKALAAIRAAVTEALSTVDASTVRSAFIGTAGPRNLRAPAAEAELKQIWHDIGLTCGYHLVSDGVVAFAAGSPEPSGTLILAGTGALIGRVADGKFEKLVDGHGWLLGDLGSAFFVGREAVRATLAGLDGHRPLGPLARSVLNEVLDDPDASPGRPTVDELIFKIHSRPPIALAELAPAVTSHVDDDPEAAKIVGDAAGHLISAAQLVRSPDSTTPLVLAGGLLVGDTPLAAEMGRLIAATWPDATVGVARDGAAGAAWLAAREIGMTPAARARLFA